MTLDALPDEILLKIMGYLDGENCHNMSSVNKNFYNLYYNNFDIINKYTISTIIVEEKLKNFLITTSYVRRASRLNKYCISKFNLDDECTFRNLMKHAIYSKLDVLRILLNGNGKFFFDKLSPIELSKLNGVNLKLSLETMERPNKMLNFLNGCQLSFNNVCIEKFGLNEVGTTKDEFYVDIGLGCSDMDLFTNTLKFHELNIVYRNLWPILENPNNYLMSLHINQFNEKMMDILMRIINGCTKYIRNIEIAMEEKYDKNHITVLQNQYLTTTNFNWTMIYYEGNDTTSFIGDKFCNECNSVENITIEYNKYWE
uniref:F-box domain-containing protein n=1 Tax=Parastrongyloides trichosuri TaxID=131310 RepID=A0A0N4ZJ13_PARTI